MNASPIDYSGREIQATPSGDSQESWSHRYVYKLLPWRHPHLAGVSGAGWREEVREVSAGFPGLWGGPQPALSNCWLRSLTLRQQLLKTVDNLLKRKTGKWVIFLLPQCWALRAIVQVPIRNFLCYHLVGPWTQACWHFKASCFGGLLPQWLS